MQQLVLISALSNCLWHSSSVKFDKVKSLPDKMGDWTAAASAGNCMRTTGGSWPGTGQYQTFNQIANVSECGARCRGISQCAQATGPRIYWYGTSGTHANRCDIYKVSIGDPVPDSQCTGRLYSYTPVSSATGDPHLVNANGKKFDVHDGKHILVRYPRDAPDSEVLLRVDGDASIVDGETSCYNVFFQSAKLSGKWVGDDILFQSSNAPMGKKEFLLGMRGNFHSWSALAHDADNLSFSGSELVKVSAGYRDATPDMPGGHKIELSIGRSRPVLMDVWSSQGSNELTDMREIQYLNLQIRNLPKDSGGLLGSDIYIKPAGAKCGLTHQESGGITSIQDLVFLQNGPRTRHEWRVSADE
jgi:hypothetical protein